MSRRARLLLFFLFVGIFLVAAPVIVLYTAGYRINTTTGKVLQSGVIALSSTPRAAELWLDGVDTDQRTPFVAQRVVPGIYNVRLTKEGYHPWEERVQVESGKTVYVDALLFAQATPIMMLNTRLIATASSPQGTTVAFLLANQALSTYDIWTFDLVTLSERRFGSVPMTPNDAPTISWSATGQAFTVFVNQGAVAGWKVSGSALTGVERQAVLEPLSEFTFVARDGYQELLRETTLRSAPERIALLPDDNYTKLYYDAPTLVLKNDQGKIFLVDIQSGVVHNVDTTATLTDWNDSTRELVVSDGNEVNIVYVDGTKTLVTRQSKPIRAVAWHPTGAVVFIATEKSIVAVDRQNSSDRVATTLASDLTLESFWTDEIGKEVYFLGTWNDNHGIFSLKLTK